jgi:hypothetical protein
MNIYKHVEKLKELQWTLIYSWFLRWLTNILVRGPIQIVILELCSWVILDKFFNFSEIYFPYLEKADI